MTKLTARELTERVNAALKAHAPGRKGNEIICGTAMEAVAAMSFAGLSAEVQAIALGRSLSHIRAVRSAVKKQLRITTPKGVRETAVQSAKSSKTEPEREITMAYLDEIIRHLNGASDAVE